ncbi:MAG TPA: MoxR family ATPase [bacterium]|nr:MoxR family ATPase [bacterium]
MNDPFSREVNDLRSACEALRGELARVIVGQREALDLVVIALLAGGHVLLEGVPGLGKTLLVRTLAQTLDLRFSRIQFTPDLMPADILGTNLVVQDDAGRRRFEFQPGPIFAQIVLADEINRATPKTQSALLEAMQEHAVTVAGESRRLEEPFFVLATQNPIEMEGTYPLPEAQLDRFLLKLRVPFPSLEDLQGIIDRTTGPDEPVVRRVADGAAVRRMQALARQVPVAGHVREYAARLVLATHPESDGACALAGRFVRHGASPRGMQALILAGKVRALTLGRFNVAIEDLRALALPALRHRIILNFEGEAEGTDADDVLRAAMQEIEAPDLPAGQREAR